MRFSLCLVAALFFQTYATAQDRKQPFVQEMKVIKIYFNISTKSCQAIVNNRSCYLGAEFHRKLRELGVVQVSSSVIVGLEHKFDLQFHKQPIATYTDGSGTESLHYSITRLPGSEDFFEATFDQNRTIEIIAFAHQ